MILDILAIHRDESGAAFVEYTALLGVILAVAVATLTFVGHWASAVWTTLCAVLGPTCA